MANQALRPEEVDQSRPAPRQDVFFGEKASQECRKLLWASLLVWDWVLPQAENTLINKIKQVFSSYRQLRKVAALFTFTLSLFTVYNFSHRNFCQHNFDKRKMLHSTELHSFCSLLTTMDCRQLRRAVHSTRSLERLYKDRSSSSASPAVLMKPAMCMRRNSLPRSPSSADEDMMQKNTYIMVSPRKLS